MNAHAMVGPFELKFNSASRANEINTWDFHMLPFNNNNIILDANQAFYLYGGRKSLMTILDQQRDFRVIGRNWEQLALFRASRKVAGGTKTKQLLMIAPVPNGIPLKLQQKLLPISGKNTIDYILLRDLKAAIATL